jgi:hypothetical protein
VTWCCASAIPAVTFAAWAFVAQAATNRDVGASAAIGFAVAPNIDAAAYRYLTDVRDTGGPAFAAALDYAGIDLYSDVFGPRISPEELPGAVQRLLRDFRERDLATVGIPPTAPIRICENGWPTGPRSLRATTGACAGDDHPHRVRPTRRPQRHALGTVHPPRRRQRQTRPVPPIRRAYSPKPAFHTLRQLIAELGKASGPITADAV